MGNPNVYDILTDLNNQISSYCTITYDRIKNMFVYTRTYAQTSNYYNMYIMPINAGSFLGFKNNSMNLKNISPTYSTYFINVNTIQCINISISGDLSFNYNNIDNCYNKWNNSDIIIQKAVDVQKNGLIKYENIDGGDSFQYWLASNVNPFMMH